MFHKIFPKLLLVPFVDLLIKEVFICDSRRLLIQGIAIVSAMRVKLIVFLLNIYQYFINNIRLIWG